jgi:hypothetical protein
VTNSRPSGPCRHFSFSTGPPQLTPPSAHLLRNPTRFRRLIGAPAFTRLFGAAAHPGVAGEVQNVFGREDELKNAPKGVPKDHKDIDLLRLRSFAVALRCVSRVGRRGGS